MTLSADYENCHKRNKVNEVIKSTCTSVCIFFFTGVQCLCSTVLCPFLLCSKVNQLSIYIYPFFFGFPSHLGHHRALSRVPCAIQQVLISYTQSCIPVNPKVPNLSLLNTSIPPSNQKSVFYICDSISVLQISSFAPFFFQISHISGVLRYLSFSV